MEVEAEGDMMGDDDCSGGDYGGREEDEREGGIVGSCGSNCIATSRRMEGAVFLHDNQPLRVKVSGAAGRRGGGRIRTERERCGRRVASRTMRRRGAFAVWEEEEEEAYRASPEPGSGEAERGIFDGFTEVMAQ